MRQYEPDTVVDVKQPAAHAVITRAMALPPNYFSAQFQLAQIHLEMDLNYARAEAEFRQYLTQVPRDGSARFFFARIDSREGRGSEALVQTARASGIDSGSQTPIYLMANAWLRCVGGDYEGALKLSTQGLQLAQEGQDRTSILAMHALGLLMLGRVEEAKPIIDEGWHLNGSTSPESYISLFARAGEIEKAKSIITNPRFDLVDQFGLAMGHLALGNIDKAFKSIQTGIENHSPGLIVSLLVAEWWDPIRGDPRFDEMLELLDSKVTHTERYLRDHSIEERDQ